MPTATNINNMLPGGKETICATNDDPIGPLSKNNIKIPKSTTEDDEIYENYNVCTSDTANEEENLYRQYTRSFRDIFHEFHNLPLKKKRCCNSRNIPFSHSCNMDK